MSEPLIPAGAFEAMKAAQEPSAPKAPASPPVDAAVPQPPDGMTQTEKKIWKLKVDGEEFDFDASDEEAVKREIMKARGADKRFQTAANTRAEAERFFEAMKDPKSLRKILEDPRVGIDLKKFAEEYVWEQIQEQNLTPEQKTARDRDRRLAEYEERERSRDEEEKKTKASERQKQFEQSYEEKITQALQLGGLPKTHASVSKMADYLEKSLRHNVDLSPQELVKVVRNDYLEEFNSVLSAADGEQLLSLIGEANAEKLRKADLKRLRSTNSNPYQKRAPAAQVPKASRPGKVSSVWKEDLQRDFLAQFGE